jgi:tetratricopeptide (TPR) repeat protein
VFAAVVVYANSLSAPFIFDDQYAIVENPSIRTLSASQSQPHNTPLAGRPVAGFTFALNYVASDLDPAPYRATNVAIHIACALLLFGFIRRTLMLPRLSPRFGDVASDLAAAAALLWTVHPLATDAVTYVTQRTESLMALFYLLTLHAGLRGHTSPHPSRWYGVAIAACALGMGSKESMATAPFMLVLFDRVFLFDSFREAFNTRWRFYLGLALTWVFLVSQLASAPRANSAGFATDVAVWTYLLNQSAVILRYLRLAVWPVDLVINYGPPVAYTVRDVLPQALVVVTLLLVTVAAFRWKPEAAFLGAWFFVTLAPSSSIIPIATEVGAERRMYMPLMAVLTGCVVALYLWSAVRTRTSRPMAATAVALVAVALAAGTIKRNGEHQSWLTLAQTTLERWPTDAAYAGVGGELARLRRDEEALPLLRVAARTDARARYNLGITLFNLSRYDEAIRELDVLVGNYPMREEVPWSRRVMGHAYARLSRWPDAVAQLRMVLAMTPHDAEARRLLVDAHNSHGVDLAQSGRFKEAIVEFRHALSLDDRNVSARYNLATALFDDQQLKESYTEAERALVLSPTNADAHHLIGKLLALQGRMREAVQHLETAIELQPDDQTIRDDLARVLRATR